MKGRAKIEKFFDLCPDTTAKVATKRAQQDDEFFNDLIWDIKDEWLERCTPELLAEYIAASKYHDLMYRGIRPYLNRLTPEAWCILLRKSPEYVYLLDKVLDDSRWIRLALENPMFIPFVPTRCIDGLLLQESLIWGNAEHLYNEAEYLKKKLQSRKGYLNERTYKVRNK